MPTLLGQLTAGTGDFIGNGAPGCSRYTAVADGTLDTLTMAVSANPLLTSLKLAVFDDIGGPLPGALLTQGTVAGDVASAGNKTVTVPGITIVNGTSYWLACLGNGETLNFSAAAGSYREDASGKTNFDATWVTAGDTVSALNLPILGEQIGGAAVARIDYTQFPKPKLRTVA